ncbi:MAG: 30S ribosomal protein S6 [Paenibacillaceae bacterium ZCTH02-B3]|nr:MAG: 30S ribosomal protein S6 [Paenibacillaceae bacterium ZCTH02-B3]
MRNYELMYIIRPDLEPDAVQAVTDKIQEVIRGGGGEIRKHEVMGKRRLAYEIGKFREGIYVLVLFSSEPSHVAELERVLRITDEVVRHLVIRDVVA